MYRIIILCLLIFFFLGAFSMAYGRVGPAVYFAGAAEADITPEVMEYEDVNQNGVFDMGDPTKAFGFGDRIISFKEGKILIGNGNGEAKYIYDKLYVYALVLEDQRTKTRIALVCSDVYLLTSADINKIKQMVDPKLGIDFIVISAAHNHMGPDTLGISGLGRMKIPKIINTVLKSGKIDSGINGKWFEKYRNKTVECIEGAAKSLRPAYITFAKSKFHMGLNDQREPHITYPDLTVMAIDGVDGAPIATLINWANHPESVLLYGDPERDDPQLSYNILTKDQKDAWGKVLTAGFPGYTREYLRKHRGGIPMYFSGPLGGMQTPLRAPLWDPEANPEYPVTTPFEKVPKEILIPNDFRFAPILGRELGKEGVKSLKENGERAVIDEISFSKRDVLIPLENNLFRLGASLGAIGYEQGILYDDKGNVDNNFGSWIGGLFVPGVKAYSGKNVSIEVSVINIGPAQIINIPAEALPESIAGFPDDFIANGDKYFPKDKKFHVTGKNYRLSAPPLKSLATGKFLFVFCLSGGELGYVIPKSDFKPPRDIKIPPFAWWWICLDAENHPHYEESNSISSEIEPILMGTIGDLLRENPVDSQR